MVWNSSFCPPSAIRLTEALCSFTTSLVVTIKLSFSVSQHGLRKLTNNSKRKVVLNVRLSSLHFSVGALSLTSSMLWQLSDVFRQRCSPSSSPSPSPSPSLLSLPACLKFLVLSKRIGLQQAVQPLLDSYLYSKVNIQILKINMYSMPSLHYCYLLLNYILQ